MTYEIECPVCDRKAQASAKTCPHCGADLSMASFDELEEVAQSIATGKRSEARAEQRMASKPSQKAPEPKPAPAAPTQAEPPKVEEGPKPAKAEEAVAEEKPPEKPAEEEPAEEKKEEGRKGLGRLFGRKKK